MSKLEKPIHIRLTAEQMDRLIAICQETKLSQSRVIGALVENATTRPAIIRTEQPTPEQTKEYA